MKIDKFNEKWKVLSNFYPTPIYYDGKQWPSVEHAYQAYKSLDEETREFVRGLPSPRDAKKAGKMIDLRDDWDSVKDTVMEDLCRIKFTSNAFCRARLLETEDAELEEGNTWGDIYWGVCNGQGQNKLGKILMKIREEIK